MMVHSQKCRGNLFMCNKSNYLIYTVFSIVLLTSCANLKINDDRMIAAVSKTATNLEEDERQFLMRLGFEDYAGMADKTLEKIENKKITTNLIAPYLLKQNSKQYAVINSARELAVLFRLAIDKSEKNKTLSSTLDRLTRLTAYHLMPFSLVGLDPVDNSVFKFKRGAQAKKLRDDYLSERTKTRYYKEAHSLNAALTLDLFTAQELRSAAVSTRLSEINELINDAILYQYEYSGLQQSRYLGRALAATLLRYTRKNQLPAYENKLQQILKSENLFLTNHTTSTLTFFNRQEQATSVKLYTGDIANEYSMGQEAFGITLMVSPKSKNNLKQANDLKLFSNPLLIPTMAYNQLPNIVQKRKKENYLIDENTAAAANQIWDESNLSGFSHAGLVEVRTDKESQLEMVWIWDINPYGNLGTVRFHTPENFSYPEKFNKIGFTHYDYKKFLRHFQKNYKISGYKNSVWESNGSALEMSDDEDDPIPVVDFTRRVQRKNYLQESVANRWMSYTEDNADTWFKNEVAPRVIGMIKKFTTSSEVLGFATSFYDREAAAYCSQFVVLAYLQGAQLDPQEEPDDFSSLAKTLTTMGVSNPAKNDRIVAPNGFAWQKNLIDYVYQVNFSRSQVFRQTENHPLINGKPTLIDQRLELINDIIGLNHIKTESKLNTEDVDTDDDDYD